MGTGGETLTFQLTANDGQTDSLPDTVNVTIKNINHAPVAEAGNDQSVSEGSLVTLDGSASYDPDGEALTYIWVQTDGPAVSLSDHSAARPTFTAPATSSASVTLSFSLSVNDGIDTSTANVTTVTVVNVNQMPTAQAGDNQTVHEGSLVTLDGALSSDPDGDSLAYSWIQTDGTSVTLSDYTAVKPAFTAHQVGSGGESLTFVLTVTDSWGSSSTDSVSIYIKDVNDPPVCVNAYPDSSVLWPPNHKLLSIRILGVNDPNSDTVSITPTGVTQDEPVRSSGDGDTSPDAIIQSDGSILLRAERSGNGDGRVYTVNFTATDQYDQSCSGSVTVTVPHSKRATAVDNGQNYNSLQ